MLSPDLSKTAKIEILAAVVVYEAKWAGGRQPCGLKRAVGLILNDFVAYIFSISRGFLCVHTAML